MSPSPSAAAVRPPISIGAWLGQAVLYALFALFIAVFSHWPSYRPLAEGQALIKISFTHTGKPVGDCRMLTEEEKAKLPPQMRPKQICPRERSPVAIEVDVNGQPVLRRSADPTGIKRDGSSSVYERLPVTAGEQKIAVRMKDNVRSQGFDYQFEDTVKLTPSQVLVIDFSAEKGAIVLQ